MAYASLREFMTRLETSGRLVRVSQPISPILEMTDTTITVQKGKEKWEISKDAVSKVTGDLKVGSKVTIEYTMAAKAIEVKEEKKKK